MGLVAIWEAVYALASVVEVLVGEDRTEEETAGQRRFKPFISGEVRGYRRERAPARVAAHQEAFLGIAREARDVSCGLQCIASAKALLSSRGRAR